MGQEIAFVLPGGKKNVKNQYHTCTHIKVGVSEKTTKVNWKSSQCLKLEKFEQTMQTINNNNNKVAFDYNLNYKINVQESIPTK